VTTDLERVGLARGPVRVPARLWLLTCDFEAFRPGVIPLWAAAMRRWAQRAREADLRFSFFVSLEDVARVRANSPAGYDELLAAARDLHAAGTRFHPHNHCLYDPDSGVKTNAHTGLPERIDGYPRRASMFYDVVYRGERDWPEWLGTVRADWERFLADAGLPLPERPAFRPGGWDHGVTDDDLRTYVRGVAERGFAYDSSATSGEFGTPSWRVGKPFGENVFSLDGGVVEVAPSWSLDCGAALLSPAGARAASELRGQRALWGGRAEGVFDTVLHFDHLFHEGRGAGRRLWAVEDQADVLARVDRFFRRLRFLRRALRMERSVTYDELEADPAV
jgi:hypothetical protein